MSDSCDGSYDDFLDALETDDGYYYTCSNGHGTLPPRRVCPHCGDRDLESEPLLTRGKIVTYTTVTVPTPRFEDDAPYVTAIATFGSVRVTGVLLGVEPADVERGLEVTATVTETETTDERTIAFRP
ncbi:OB-fold domain-containing protein [Natronococcus sp. A-GB7]|uniref:Zn-ribbon domain-containing OB-fold protein n=1 Tax=Natronococcus sp. A-GB7 TaxID=3037649 RepID=UPI00241F3677|nr:OB-fold domain-containing protein [Natronococcus sp. A-GB7]MDG5821466.1 OB-fold domain-containing protein [Natronococcus sp. A-GB7]